MFLQNSRNSGRLLQVATLSEHIHFYYLREVVKKGPRALPRVFIVQKIKKKGKNTMGGREGGCGLGGCGGQTARQTAERKPVAFREYWCESEMGHVKVLKRQK